MRKIAVCTGTRADYGLLRGLLRELAAAPEVILQLIVTGAHLSPEFGLTVREIEGDGFPIAERVQMLVSSDTDEAIAQSMGLGMIGFGKAFTRLRPDLLVLLGDRFEILAAAASALPFRIPIAHIHGGESTEGAMDELIRHAVTKLSHLHFTSTQRYGARVIQMGERPDRVFVVGAPGLDQLAELPPPNGAQVRETLGLPRSGPLGIVTFHPATLEEAPGATQIQALLEALSSVRDVFWIITLPNADAGGRLMGELGRRFADQHPERARAFVSLGRHYLQVLREASVMVGNSSSGLIEAPSLQLPVVNIGSRQAGRVRARNVIDVVNQHPAEIVAAINLALSPAFRSSLTGLENPYGNGGSSAEIARVLTTLPLTPALLIKRFHEGAT